MMGRYCYCSKVLPGKTATIKEHWQNKGDQTAEVHAEEIAFFNAIKLTSFDSWIQPTAQGDFMIHCLEGPSLQEIFKGLREQIAIKNPVALKLHAFYLDVLGKDYSLLETEPKIELLMDLSLPSARVHAKCKWGHCYPLLTDKEQEHRQFRKEAMGTKKTRHEATMRAFGSTRLSVWLQHTPNGKYIIGYNEAGDKKQGQDSEGWKDISAILMDHTGLPFDQLSPTLEWLTQPKN